MEVHVLEGQDEITYPIGSHIDEAIHYIDRVFLKLNLNGLYVGKDINLWCRGSSGAILAALLASRLLSTKEYGTIHIVHIKKNGETAHRKDVDFTNVFDTINIIIDDFSYTGTTINAIVDSMVTKEIQYIDAIILSNTALDYPTVTDEDPRIGLKFPYPRLFITNEETVSTTSIKEALEELQPTQIYIPLAPEELQALIQGFNEKNKV